MKTKKKIMITKFDYDRLKSIILEYSKINRIDANLDDLLGEIERAQKVDSYLIPKNIVTMNSIIEIKNEGEYEFKEFQLVFPEDSNLDENKISILAPIATASLGYKTGNFVHWNVPGGEKRFQITNIKYQPEASGHYHL